MQEFALKMTPKKLITLLVIAILIIANISFVYAEACAIDTDCPLPKCEGGKITDYTCILGSCTPAPSDINCEALPLDMQDKFSQWCQKTNELIEKANQQTNTCPCTIEKLVCGCEDNDKDGYLGYDAEACPTGDDCDDDPSDDYLQDFETKISCPALSEIESKTISQFPNKFIKELSLEQKKSFCYNDANNDGIGDYAHCSLCINSGMPEVCDNIDNNCAGRCQGHNTESYPKTCFVSEYTGDGADDISDLDGRKALGSCIGVKNKFNKIDNFCQMVDELIDVGEDKGNLGGADKNLCGGYSRCVKWGVLDSHVARDTTTSEYVYEYDFKRYAFVPGGISYNFDEISFIPCSSSTSTDCSHAYNPTEKMKFDGAEVGIETWHIGNGIGKPLMNRDFTLKNVNTLLLGEESNANRRNTPNLPIQFIDSMYGELDFNSFIDLMKQEDIVSSDGEFNSNWNWQTACVAKDKCSDNADNDGPEDIFTVLPYSDYSSMANIQQEQPDGKIVAKKIPVYYRLVDVDDQDCKFSNYENIDQSRGYMTYNQNNYRINPLTDNVPYCEDKDKDGFCSCSINFEREYTNEECYDWGINPECVCQIWDVSHPSSCLLAKKVIDHAVSCNYTITNDRGYLVSSAFTDCDDNINDDSYIYELESSPNHDQPVKTTPHMGWGIDMEMKDGKYTDIRVGQSLSAWHIHPFAPKAIGSCSLNFDVDCSKNIEDLTDQDAINPNAELTALLNGITPYDIDTSTGRETVFLNSDRKDVDSLCYSSNPNSKAWKEFGLGASYIVAGMAVIITGGAIAAFAGAGTPFLFLAVGGGTALTGDQLGKCLGKASVEGIDVNSATLANTDSAFWNCYYAATGVADIITGTALPAMPTYKRIFKITQPTKVNPKGHIQLLESISKKGVSPVYKIMAKGKVPPLELGIQAKTAGCFLENASVLLSNQTSVAIQDIKEGDKVMAYDIENNYPVNAEVTSTFVRPDTKYYIINYEVGEDNE